MIDTWQFPAPPPHGGQPVLLAGAPPGSARAAVILLHGRGATALGILDLAVRLAPPPSPPRPQTAAGGKPEGEPSSSLLSHAPADGTGGIDASPRSVAEWEGGLLFLAPQAANHTWYPHPFLAPLDQNEPDLSSALAGLAGLLDHLAAAGIPASRTAIVGFSQGACLGLEYVARNARRYGAVAGLSAGLVGPPGAPRDYLGSLDATPVYLACGERDPHIPKARVLETAAVLRALGGLVTLRLDPLLGHTIDDAELDAVRALLAPLTMPEM